MWKIPSIKQLTEAGVAFGHRRTRGHPKMAPYIKGIVGTIQMIDLEKTAEKLEIALKFLEATAKNQGVILFVGTKPSAKEIVKKYAEEVEMPYVTEKWIAGTITNFETINLLRKKFLKMEEEKNKGEWEKYTKKEILELERELLRLQKMVGGIRNLEKLPDAFYLIDLVEEKTAVREITRKKIPTVALVDTNTNPELVSHPIPANDDAIKSVELITSLVAEAIKEGNEK